MLFHSKMRSMAGAAVALATGFVSIEAFCPLSPASQLRPLMVPNTKKPRTIMYRIRCENKYYQLEELEDADNCTTELFLKADGTADIGETDGPLFSKAIANWEIKENSFAMTIIKTYSAGNEGNDMGEFSYDVKRVFHGEMAVVGGTTVAINGKIYAEDVITEKHEMEVGFFNMIDGTEVRLDRRTDARPKELSVSPSPLDSNGVTGQDRANTNNARGFGQDTQSYGGGGHGDNDPGPPSFAGYGQPPQEEEVDLYEPPIEDQSPNGHTRGTGLPPTGDGGYSSWS